LQGWGAPSVYVTVRPCRVADTRLAGGALAAGEARSFAIGGEGTDLSPQGGSALGCGIPLDSPLGVSAVLLDVVAVAPQGPGHLKVYSSNEPEPPTSVLNFAGGTTIANALPVSLDCGDPNDCGAPGFTARAQASGTHLVVDVVGYFGSTVTAQWPLRIHNVGSGGIHATTLPVGTSAILGAGLSQFTVGVQGTSDLGIGVFAQSEAGVPLSVQRSGAGKLVEFRSQQGADLGEIVVDGSGTVSYNAFTGSHYAWARGPLEPGMLVALTGENRRQPSGETVHGVRAAASDNDPAVLGVYSGRLDPARPEADFTANPALVQAVGNGDVWVVDTGSDLEPGDLLVSSTSPGDAMKAPPALERAFVVARVAERLRWAAVAPDAAGRRRARVAVLFEPGVRVSTAGLRGELAALPAQNAALASQLTAVLAELRSTAAARPVPAGLVAADGGRVPAPCPASATD
jgi:hypothetical protein